MGRITINSITFSQAPSSPKVVTIKHKLASDPDVDGSYTTDTPPLANPVQAAPSTAATGGTLAAATYFYVVTATVADGQTLKSNEQSIVTTGATSSNTINWGAVTGATGYRIYRGATTGGQNVYYSVGAVTSFVDTGAISTGGTPPLVNTTTTVVAPVDGNINPDFVISGLLDETSYTVKIFTLCGGGSVVQNFTTGVVCPNVTSITAVGSAG